MEVHRLKGHVRTPDHGQVPKPAVRELVRRNFLDEGFLMQVNNNEEDGAE